jgi:transcriptional regulator GlxA family with amidase domain
LGWHMKTTTKRRTVKVAILTFNTFATIPVTGPMDILNKSCALTRGMLHNGTDGATFEIELVALSKGPLHFGDSVTLHPHASIATAKWPDLVLIPSVGDNVLESLRSLRPFIPWIKACAARGARIVSLCTGAFLLAESGLLDGRTATTHWFFADLFRKTYPKVDLHPERLIVDEGNVITSGAATSFLDLVLYLIELYRGHDAAVLTAKVLLIEMGRRTQLPYTIFSTHKMHDDRQILRAQQWMETQLHRGLAIDDLARQVGMSVRSFDRRFRNRVGEAPSVYLQKLRIEKAKRLLETSGETVEQIMFAVGYEDERSFRRLFHKLTDLSPKAYRRKYRAQNSLISTPANRSVAAGKP